MRSWLQNLKIRYRLALIISISLISLALMGLFSIYLINTSRMMHMEARGKEYQFRLFHQSYDSFLYYLDTKNPDYLPKIEENINKNIELLEFFSSLRKSYNTQSDQEIFEQSLPLFLPFLNNSDNIKLYLNRFKLFMRLNNEKHAEILNLAAQIAENAKGVLRIMQSYIASPDDSKLEHLEIALEERFILEAQYDLLNEEIILWIKNVLKFGILFFIVFFSSITVILAYRINISITKPIEQLVDISKRIAVNDLSTSPKFIGGGEINLLAMSFLEVKKNLQDIVV